MDDERIRQAIIEFRPRLVVIDPIQAYLGSDSDLQIAGRARKLMQRLGMWASVYDCAIVLIGHLNKKEGTKGLYRSLGSIDVVAAARSVLQVERDQEDTDIRIVRQIKNSLAPSDGEIRFSITAEMGFQLPVLSVVKDGILRGYVPFDKDWTGFSAEEYREASESVMKEPDAAVTADVKKRLDLTGYEVVRAQYFSTMQNPAMTISNGRLRFNTACLKKFENIYGRKSK